MTPDSRYIIHALAVNYDLRVQLVRNEIEHRARIDPRARGLTPTMAAIAAWAEHEASK